MGRWEPKTRERLERAALALFLEHGYDATTVAQIAERAGLTKSTFFRHFADKREVLFGGQETLGRAFADAILNAPPAATVIDCLAAALTSARHVFVPERLDMAPQRRAVIAAQSDLQERALLKRAHLSSAIAGAFRKRGLDDAGASLAAEIGALAFFTAYERWAADGGASSYEEIVHQTLREFQQRAKVLGETPA